MARRKLTSLGMNAQRAADMADLVFWQADSVFRAIERTYGEPGRLGGGWVVSNVLRLDMDRIAKGQLTLNEAIRSNLVTNPTRLAAWEMFTANGVVYWFCAPYVGATRRWIRIDRYDLNTMARDFAWGQRKQRVRGAFVAPQLASSNRMRIRVPHR